MPHPDVGDAGTAKAAVVDVEVACPKSVGDAVTAIVKDTVPNPPVQRVEILDADARLGTSQEATPHHRCLRHACFLHRARFYPEGDIAEDHVGELVVGDEVRSAQDRRAGFARSVQGQPPKCRIPSIGSDHHAPRFPVPSQHRRFRMLADDDQMHGFAMTLTLQAKGFGEAVSARRKVNDGNFRRRRTDEVEGFLQRFCIVGDAVTPCPTISPNIQPTGERTDELIGVHRQQPFRLSPLPLRHRQRPQRHQEERHRPSDHSQHNTPHRITPRHSPFIIHYRFPVANRRRSCRG